MNAIAAHVNGFQHVGIPTENLEKTVEFYEKLGFTVVKREEIPSHHVAFLQLKDMVIEAYESTDGVEATGVFGAVDHIALDVDDVDAVFEAAKAEGLVPEGEEIEFLPFWEKGFRYFKILDPNNAIVEFGQIL